MASVRPAPTTLRLFLFLLLGSAHALSVSLPRRAVASSGDQLALQDPAPYGDRASDTSDEQHQPEDTRPSYGGADAPSDSRPDSSYDGAYSPSQGEEHVPSRDEEHAPSRGKEHVPSRDEEHVPSRGEEDAHFHGGAEASSHGEEDDHSHDAEDHDAEDAIFHVGSDDSSHGEADAPSRGGVDTPSDESHIDLQDDEDDLEVKVEEPVPLGGGKFLLGVGKADITGPVAELVMAGYAHSTQEATGLRQRMYSRAFIIADVKRPENRLLYVLLDNINGDASVRFSILEGLTANGGEFSLYGPHNVAITSVHSHSGPSTGWNYFLPQVPQSGFDRQGHQAIVDGALRSIKRAHKSMQEGYLDVATIEIENAGINRSRWAYLANPAAERAKYERDVDTTMTGLRLRRASDGKSIGLVTWFPVHGTSLYGNNTHVTGDNKGLASWMLERKMRKLSSATHDFVAGFGQANLADVTPNTEGAWCEDGSGKPCNLTDSSCPDGKVTKCRARGPMFREEDLGVSSCHEIARRQAVAAEKLLTSVDTSWTPLRAELGLKGYHFYHNMAWWTFTAPNGSEVTTCPAALGHSFAAGTSDGPGLFDFVQGEANKPKNPLWKIVFGILRPPTGRQKKCQYPKPILFDGGEMSFPYAWAPNIVDVAMFRIGQLFIILSPSEVTTMSGRRWKSAVAKEASTFVERPIVVIASPTNSYAHYLTTKEEYDVQRYEGASTLFGRWQLDAYVNLSVSSMHYLVPGSNNLPEQGVPPPDNRKKSFNFNLGITADSTPFSGAFGKVLRQPESQYRLGSDVQATFQGANPRNNLRLEDTYTAVERLGANGNWTRVRDDEDWFLVFTWRRTAKLIGRSEVDVTWETKGNAKPGTYRLKYYGDAKTLSRGIMPFEATSRQFTLQAR